MKNFLAVLCITTVLISCSNSSEPADISGTYILGEKTPDFERYDTVFLKRQGAGYRLNNHYQFKKFIEGVIVNKENRKIYSTVYYNESARQYFQAETGSVLFFDNEKQLVYNNRHYKKIK